MSKRRRIYNVLGVMAVVTGTVLATSGALGSSAAARGGHGNHGGDGPRLTATKVTPEQIAATYRKLPERLRHVGEAYEIARQVASSGKAAELLRIYAATAKYLDLDVARADGFAQLPGPQYCVVNVSGPGAMGYHFLNVANLQQTMQTGVYDTTKPHVLVYVPNGSGGLRLGAVEWAKLDEDQNLATDGDRPAIIGSPFDGPMLGHEPLPDGSWLPIHFDRHMWLYTYNPTGIFNPYNTGVVCPPGDIPPPHPQAAG
ncbi:hypothetical protein [Rhizohabitans arisaemae]|uniref:hypothetical protein n=1 Tax=Rhizohabitans arisaemae TaxID=2720610 RepID=UPI0024B11B4D|nr:hypothetical protein [Rhizohabitans arisaemae]